MAHRVVVDADARSRARARQSVRNKDSGDERVAKTFDSREQFEKAKKNLMMCKDDKGKERIIQYKGSHLTISDSDR